ncbi:MAG: hypothetical protein KAY32_02840 [Candidatus Eisenbacteria sp.]|nr:hypothetical protein [Candidatus Eisenbacteria bacterium]
MRLHTQLRGLLLSSLAAILILPVANGLVRHDHRAPATSSPVAQDTTVRTVYRVTGTGRYPASSAGLTIFNNGFLGNNMASRDPSFEYPLGEDEEHLVRAGIWVAGLFSDSALIALAETLTTTTTLDGYYGGSGDTESEFYPVYGEFSVLSLQPLHESFSLDAKSDEDLICEYHDERTYPGSLHRPLHVRVVQEVMQYAHEPYNAIILINFYIINNHPTHPIFDIYAGLYAELASGWKGAYDEWPPSGWFRNKDIAYVDSLRLITEHHWREYRGNCPSWGGYMLLGTTPDTLANKRVSFNMWDWDPAGTNPETPHLDVGRYLALGNGDRDPTGGVEGPNEDPVTLLSVGPLGTESFLDSVGVEHWFMLPGDTVTVSYAFIGGTPSPDASPPRNASQDMAFNAGWAQFAYDHGFKIPLPPPPPRLKIENYHSRIRLWWDDSPLYVYDLESGEQDFEGFRIYMSDEGKSVGFRQLGDFDLRDSLFFDTGLEAITPDEPLVEVVDGDTTVYRFRFDIDGVRDGFKHWVAVTSYDRGTLEIDPLESGLAQNRVFTIPGPQLGETPEGKVIVFPNPYRGDAAWDEEQLRDRYLWFAGLPPRCKIRIYTLAGDLVKTIDFDARFYGATDVRGIYDPDDPNFPAGDIPELSGNMAAWDLTTRKDQAIATGLYVFSVENLETGDVEHGKFLIMK